MNDQITPNSDLEPGLDLNTTSELTPELTAASLVAGISEQVRQLCQRGYTQFDEGEIKAAIRRFYEAWTLLPKPQHQWPEAGWVLTALGDAYVAKGDFVSGREALESALHCPQTQGNPIIHCRLGQCLFELGELAGAKQQWAVVTANGGEQLLAQLDAKYSAR
ncbi:MAG: tetratricopeptide (TPR) repeat protein [Oceanicoccus sp.]|jgi:tetratricopeptide (TPR) repeat protein